MGLPGNQAVHVRQQDEKVRSETAHHQRAQLVIIAETVVRIRFFEFFGGHRVVFIDDRNDFHVQQGHQRVSKIAKRVGLEKSCEVSSTCAAIRPCFGKALLVDIHQPALSDGGKGLFVHEQGASSMQRTRSQRNRAGRDHQDLAPGETRARKIFDERADAVERKRVFAVEEEIGSEFDDDAARVLILWRISSDFLIHHRPNAPQFLQVFFHLRSDPWSREHL